MKRVVVIFGDPSKKDLVKPNSIFDEDDLETIKRLKDALNELKDYEFIYLTNHDTLEEDLKKQGNIDLVFNLCDEGLYNDMEKEGEIPKILERFNIPYTGAGPGCMKICYDKHRVNQIALNSGILVPESQLIKPGEPVHKIEYKFPVIVKPRYGDGGVGITEKSVAKNIQELEKAVEEVGKSTNKDMIIQEFVNGDDLSCGIIGNPNDCEPLPITKEDYSELPENLPKICGYEAKWLPDSPYWNIRSIKTDLPNDVKAKIIMYSLDLFDILGCRDYARVDWRLDERGDPRLLEVNPNPGWCWDGHLAKMAGINGISYPAMLNKILKTAEKRIGENKISVMIPGNPSCI